MHLTAEFDLGQFRQVRTRVVNASERVVQQAVEKSGNKFLLVTAGEETGVSTQVNQLEDLIAKKVDRRITSEQIEWDSRLRDDLGIDSLAVAELLYEIEETFGTPLEETEPGKLVTLRDAVDAIERGLQLPPAN